MDPFNIYGGKTATKTAAPATGAHLDPFGLNSYHPSQVKIKLPSAADIAPSVQHLNPFQKAAVLVHGAVPAVAKSIASPFEDALKGLGKANPFRSSGPKVADILTAQDKAKKAVQSGKVDASTQKAARDAQSLKANQILANPNLSNDQKRAAIQPIVAQRNAEQNKAIGDAAQIGSLGIGAGELGKVVQGSSLVKGLLVNAAAGAVGNAGSTLSSNTKSTGKELLKSGAEGAAIGAGTTLLGGALSKAHDALSKAPKVASGASTVATSALHIPGKNVYAKVSPEQLDTLKNETKNIPFSKGDMPHLTPVSSLERAGAKEVSLDELASQSPNAKKALSMAAEVSKSPETSLVENKAPAYTKEVQQTLDKVKVASGATGTGKGAVGELQSLLTPGKDTKAVQNDLRAATGNLALKTNTERQAAKDSVKAFAKNKAGDNLNFIQKVESGVKQDTPELQKAADGFRTQFDQDYELAKTLKPNLPYLDNYFSQSGIWKDSKAADDFAKRFQTPTLGGKPGALEQRTFPTIYDGVKAGLELKETNPAVIAINNRTSLLKAKMAQDFLEEQSAKGVDPAVAQRVVDTYLQPGLQGSDTYKTAKSAAYALNSLQLGLSGFHVTGTALNAVFSKFANGLQEVTRGELGSGIKDIAGSTTAPIKYILNGNKIIKDLNAGNITKDISNIAEGGGRIGTQVDYNASGLSKSLEQIKSGNVLKGVAAAPLRAINSAAKPIMDWWVPRIKAGATKELIDRKLAELGPNASQDAIRAAKSTAIDSIDNRFGQLVQDNLFWDKRVKDISSVLMRSPGWNIGTVREVGGGAKDLLSPSKLKTLATGGGLSERSAYTLSLAAGTALIGTAMSYLYTGKAPSSPIDYFYPKTGKTDKNGNNERVSLPTYAKDIFAFVHNPAQTVGNKLSPVLSAGKQLATNKDYFGNEIRNPEDSLGTQAKQTAGFISKNALPFSLTNSTQRVDKSASAKTQGFFGVNPAPAYITKSPFEQKVQGALNQALGSKPLTPEESATVNAKSQAKQAAKFGDNSQIDQLVKTGQLTKKQGDDLKQSSTQTSLANQFSYLMKVDRPAAAKLIQKASPEDIQKLGDRGALIKALNKTLKSSSKTTKQSTKDASRTLIQVLNRK